MIKNRIFLAALLMACSQAAMALTWDSLWLNPDQQGFKALTENNPQLAAKDFNSPEWKGVAYYRLKEYNKALAAFSKGTDATSFYNSGNALALLGRYQDAIKAYDKALALDPAFEDARFNRNLLQKASNNTPPPSASTTPPTAPPFKRRFNDRKNSSQDQTEAPSNNAAATSAPAQQNTAPSSTQPQNSSQSNDTRQPATGSIATSYQDQQQQQALQDINDNPDGLLQKKLARDYAASQQQGN